MSRFSLEYKPSRWQGPPCPVFVQSGQKAGRLHADKERQ